MKQLWRICLFAFLTVTLSNVAYANMGPGILLAFSIHLVFLTWIIGLGEGVLLCMLFRVWKTRSWRNRIFISMIAANFTSAYFGMLFVKSRYAAQIMGDMTIETVESVFWVMVYVTFVLTIIIEFPFFLVALYGRKWLIPKAVAATIFVHCISYSLLFFFYGGEDPINMVTELEVVPASIFEMKEDYDLYYISPDGKHVMKSDLAGEAPKEIATIEMEGIPDRLCACPREISDKIKEGTEIKFYTTVPSSYLKSESDLYVLMNINGKYKTSILLENFSPYSTLKINAGEFIAWWDIPTDEDDGNFRTFGNAQKWEFYSRYWGPLVVTRVGPGSQPYTSAESQNGSAQEMGKSTTADYWIHAPFVQWPIRNGTHIAGDYAVFKLGKDQICIMDPEKKRIALIARGFGPVVAKPHVETPPVEAKE